MSLCSRYNDTGLISVEEGPAGATVGVLVKCPRCQSDTVIISRVQYEALISARQTLQLVLSLYEDANPKRPLPKGTIHVEPPWVDQARTALRTASILEGE